MRSLDLLAEQILNGECFEAYDCLLAYLCGMRRNLETERWKSFTALFQEHPLHRLLCQSPLHRRAFQKPRGYAEDGVMLDLLYGLRPLPADISPIGDSFYRWHIAQPGSHSMRSRIDLLSRRIDAAAYAVAGARVLAVACGHLREAQQSHAVREKILGRLIALDQDPENLTHIDRRQGSMHVETIEASIKWLLSGRVAFEELDLIYSSGLFHYLSDATAASLARVLFAMLRPGGILLFANFAPRLPEIALLEACMDWWPHYRNESGCERITREIPACHPRRLFRDADHNVVFAEVRKSSFAAG